MSITAYTGLPGHGKSYGVTENVILPTIKAGRPLYTNIPLQVDLLESYCEEKRFPAPQVHQVELSEFVEDPQKLLDIPGGSVIVLDEIWELFPSGLKANSCPTEYKEFLAKHRHRVGEDGFSQEIVLVTQDLGQVAAFARQLVEETYITNKLTALGSSKKYRIDIYQRGVTGNPPKKPMRQIFGSFKKEVYQFYQSHTESKTGNAGNETKADDRANGLKSASIKFGLPFAFVMLLLGVFGVKSAFSAFFGEDEVNQVDQVAHDNGTTHIHPPPYIPPQPQPDPQASTPKNETIIVHKPAEPSLSRTWRLSGIIQGKKNGDLVKIAYLTSDSGSRHINASSICTENEITSETECILDDEIITSYSGRVQRLGSTNIRPGEQITM